MQNNISDDRLLTVEEVGRYLGFAPGTIYNKAARGEIPSVKLGSALRFRKSEIDRWIDETSGRAPSGTPEPAGAEA